MSPWPLSNFPAEKILQPRHARAVRMACAGARLRARCRSSARSALAPCGNAAGLRRMLRALPQDRAPHARCCALPAPGGVVCGACARASPPPPLCRGVRRVRVCVSARPPAARIQVRRRGCRTRISSPPRSRDGRATAGGRPGRMRSSRCRSRRSRQRERGFDQAAGDRAPRRAAHRLDSAAPGLRRTRDTPRAGRAAVEGARGATCAMRFAADPVVAGQRIADRR